MEIENKNTVDKNIGTERLRCIDAFRGITLALMLLCDSPGNTERVYVQLRHAEWNGCTIADLGFPFFIIIMGMVVPYALNRRLAKGISPLNIFAHILLRSVGIFILGLLLNGFPLYDLSSIRILGVLQRIAIVYLIIGCTTLSILYLIRNKIIQVSIQLGIAFTIIIVYYLLMKYVNVPGFGRGILAPDGNLAQYIDLKFLKGHLYRTNWDPEGILSTLPAIASGLFGVIIGQVLTYNIDKKIYKFLVIFTFGIILLIFASSASNWIPFNKNLWSSSFVLITAGLACLFISVLYFIMDIIKYDFIFNPFITLGSSSIFVYLVSEIVRKTLWIIPITDKITNKTLTLNVWITTNYVTPWAGTRLDSAYFSIVYIIVWIAIMSSFYNKKSFMKL